MKYKVLRALGNTKRKLCDINNISLECTDEYKEMERSRNNIEMLGYGFIQCQFQMPNNMEKMPPCPCVSCCKNK